MLTAGPIGPVADPLGQQTFLKTLRHVSYLSEGALIPELDSSIAFIAFYIEQTSVKNFLLVGLAVAGNPPPPVCS